MRFVALILAFFVLGNSTEAVAKTDRVQKAQALAHKMWGPVCNGNVKVFRAAIAPDRIAEATMDGSCEIRFQKGMKLSWGAFCTNMLHEYGHLANYRPPMQFFDPVDPLHSTNENSIMFFTYWKVHPWCKR